MKKFTPFFILLFIILLGQESRAQYRSIRFGFNASPSLTWLKPTAEGYERKGLDIGFSWGMDAEFFLMENYAIQSGFKVLFINGTLDFPHQIIPDNANVGSGDTPEPTPIKGKLERRYKYQYLQVPIMMKMMTKDFGRYRFYGRIGLGTAIRLGAKSEDTFHPDSGETQTKNKDLNKQTKLFRESLLLGIGTEYDLGGTTRLVFGISFDNGFIDILKDQNTVDPSIEHSAINNALEVNLGIIF